MEVEDFNPLEAKVLKGAIERGGVSKIYHSLIINTPDRFDMLRARWKELLGGLEEEDWREA